MKLIKIIAILLVLPSLIILSFLVFDKKQGNNIIPIRQVYSTQEECENSTGKNCVFNQCDYTPEGKTFEEFCGKDFKKGWSSIN